jgi:hypothetical protein
MNQLTAILAQLSNKVFGIVDMLAPRSQSASNSLVPKWILIVDSNISSSFAGCFQLGSYTVALNHIL